MRSVLLSILLLASGELVISQIRETDVLGTFTFTGIDGGGLVVTVTGQFRVPTSAAEAYL